MISEPVTEALSRGEPVVALESTIITHGLPHPRNLETALAVEAAVRDNGAVPATIAVIDGVLRVGLDETALGGLATTTDVRKLSRADIAAAIVEKATGSTTVAATMIAAHLAGIETFATRTSIAAQRIDIELTIVTRKQVLVRISPRVLRQLGKVTTFFPVANVRIIRPRNQRVEPPACARSVV